MPKPPRLLWPDLMRAAAISLVVLIHITGSILNTGYFASGKMSWWIAEIINSIARCGVPLFFMSSGALLLDKVRGDTAWGFIKKRMSRILVPFFAWSIIFLLIQAGRGTVHLSIMAFLNILREPVYYHLWFFYSIIGLYLVTPFFKGADKNTMRYAVIFWFLAVPVMFVFGRAFGFLVNGNFQSILPCYLGYFILGFLLKNVLLTKKMTLIVGMIFIGLCAVTALGTAVLSFKNNGFIDGFFFDYLNVNIVAGSIALFCLLRTIGENAKENVSLKIVRFVSAGSLGIFALHPLLLEFLASGKLGIKLSAAFGTALVGVALTFVLVMTLTTGATILMAKVPLLKRIV